MNRFRTPTLVLLAVALLYVGGCIQRTITIESDPPGALAYLNDVEVGRTPVSVPFTFYGTYDVRLELDGYQTLQTTAKAEAPLWEAPGPDLIAEALPGNNEVEIKWNFTMEQAGPVDEKQLVERARQLRSRAYGEPETEDAPETPADEAAPAEGDDATPADPDGESAPAAEDAETPADDAPAK